jgi:hypothetical protein
VKRVAYQHCTEFTAGNVNIDNEHEQVVKQRRGGYYRGPRAGC